ncbi:52 kDa repressor of the inhibitor of the protein kinase-like [Melanaphis sacchari]|uniref:52 kDa repressor of the inhibitor of the protein kinase-like n=1 Tax=Melanaphis sacchari TaxID=742174 RepID=UPI000DC1424B|nr:52 kDa repressor of the inhibitor of the protein kinase-like [Melanaphis sacchari]
MSNLMNQWLKRKNEDCTDNTDSTNKKKINETIVTPSATSGSSTLNSLVTINIINSPSFELDVAHFIKDSNVICSDHDRAKLITMDNLPENDFILPFSVHIKKGKDRDLEVHSKNIYHINCVQVADDFMKTFNNPQKEVINLINSERMKQITENRNRLKPIVESIIFLGRQNIPLRGHRDHGDFFENYNEGHSIVNQGNFRELLNYRIKAGDLALENHLKTTHSKATYISPVIQNELIDCCKSTTDISHTSQMSLVLRYLCKGVVKENFVCFIDCHAYAYNEKCTTLIGDDEDKNDNINEKDINFEPKLNGDTLGEIVISLLKNYGLDLQYCVGVGTDGCSVMVSEVRGAVKKIQSHAKNAVHSPCSNHSLNLSISKSSTVQSIRNSVGLMKEILQFFNCSSKRNFVLKTILNGQQRLLSLCETRWTERHDSVMVFKTSIPYIIKSLTKISEWQESDSSSKARTLLTALCSCEFIIAIHSLANILCVTAPVSRILQGLNYDILNAKNCIDDIIFNLENKRTNCLVIFGDIYQECVLLMNEMDIEVKIPRLSKYQTKRSNHPKT